MPVQMMNFRRRALPIAMAAGLLLSLGGCVVYPSGYGYGYGGYAPAYYAPPVYGSVIIGGGGWYGGGRWR